MKMYLQRKCSVLSTTCTLLILSIVLPLPSFSFLLRVPVTQSVDGSSNARHKLPTLRDSSSGKLTSLNNRHLNFSEQVHFAFASRPPRPRPRTCTRLHMVGGYESIFSAYSNALVEHPIVTNGCSGLVLCGIGDIVAQMGGFQAMMRSNSVDDGDNNTPRQSPLLTIDYLRLARFATKGVFSTLIWYYWYVFSNTLYSAENIASMFTGLGIMQDVGVLGISSPINIVRIFMLIVTEQFVVSPIVYILWDIPVATIMNGAPVSNIFAELRDKLVPMLTDNFKFWTPANIVIYSAPVEFRSVMANLGNIVWQSVMSDYAANCGTSKYEECNIGIIDDGEPSKNMNTPNTISGDVVSDGQERRVVVQV